MVMVMLDAVTAHSVQQESHHVSCLLTVYGDELAGVAREREDDCRCLALLYNMAHFRIKHLQLHVRMIREGK